MSKERVKEVYKDGFMHGFFEMPQNPDYQNFQIANKYHDAYTNAYKDGLAASKSPHGNHIKQHVEEIFNHYWKEY